MTFMKNHDIEGNSMGRRAPYKEGEHVKIHIPGLLPMIGLYKGHAADKLHVVTIYYEQTPKGKYKPPDTNYDQWVDLKYCSQHPIIEGGL